MRDCENCVYAKPFGGENDIELISRDEVIEVIENICNTPCNKYFVNAVKSLPTIEERKEGKWIPYLPEYGDMYKCSECKEIVRLPFKPIKMPYKYCPNCGARMKGE